MVLDMKLHTTTFTSNKNGANQLSMSPNLAIFCNDSALRIRSIEIGLIRLYDVEGFGVCNGLFLALPESLHASLDLVFDSGQP